ncbi:SDR family oxidoreductase [Demequina capsici]|uniref:SDR family oxidoreductase n=1 Tax=Demequina capsici TaxID=3075620 RepID=A0AA96FDK1_9MICO|nr:SDR family oxidoreductase [Demequina sp. PMTSA13]WNM26435.1 SDR family oxidoreductase [Demequina sp. PMTSA13]
MHILVTGATGWIGSHLVPLLSADGHQVTGLARSDASAAALTGAGHGVIRGGLADVDVIADAAAAADAVVHLAYVHDFSDPAAQITLDRGAIGAIGETLAGTGKPFVFASGTPVGPGRPSKETDLGLDGALAARAESAQIALAFADRGVRTSAVRLPRSVHGTGDHGFIAQLVAIARSAGVAGYVGDGAHRWNGVHVDDAARLFRDALYSAPGGTVLHAIGDEGVRVKAIAESIGRGLGLPTASVEPAALGFLGMLQTMDHASTSTVAQDLLGWQPQGATLLDDIDAGHYFD